MSLTDPPGFVMEPDGSGGAFVAWIDQAAPKRVIVQSIDAQNGLRYGSEGVVIASDVYPGAPHLTPDGAGGVIVVWSRFGTVTAQRVDATGHILWGAGGARGRLVPERERERCRGRVGRAGRRVRRVECDGPG